MNETGQTIQYDNGRWEEGTPYMNSKEKKYTLEEAKELIAKEQKAQQQLQLVAQHIKVGDSFTLAGTEYVLINAEIKDESKEVNEVMMGNIPNVGELEIVARNSSEPHHTYDERLTFNHLVAAGVFKEEEEEKKDVK